MSIALPLMNQEIKRRWIEALRSGQYKQGKSCLRGLDDTFCCLGVLTDLYVQEHGKKWIQSSNFNCNFFTFDGEGGVLPRSVIKWAGIYYENPVIGDFNLATFNDQGKSFTEIADLINQHL